MTTDTLTAEPVAAAEKRGCPMLHPSRIKPCGGHFWTNYQAVVPFGHTLEDTLTSPYWSNVAASRELRQHDRIELRCEDGEWGADLIVLEAGRRFARVMLVQSFKFDTEAAKPEAIGLTVAYKGPVLKHVVIRDSDKAILRQGFSKKTDAENWARDYTRIAG